MASRASLHPKLWEANGQHYSHFGPNFFFVANMEGTLEEEGLHWHGKTTHKSCDKMLRREAPDHGQTLNRRVLAVPESHPTTREGMQGAQLCCKPFSIHLSGPPKWGGFKTLT